MDLVLLQVWVIRYPFVISTDDTLHELSGGVAGCPGPLEVVAA